MTRKKIRTACGVAAAIGFSLLIGVAGASDLEAIPLGRIITQGTIGFAMFAGGLWLGGYLT